MRLSTALVQPIASDDVADAVARVVVEPPVNGIYEIAGPERAPLPALARRYMDSVQDDREVVGDAHALYFGAELDTDTLVPQGAAWQGTVDFERWIAQSAQALQEQRA